MSLLGFDEKFRPGSRYWARINYIETQIWGPIELSDVEAFIFKTDPPRGLFLKKLRENGIEVYDASDSNQLKKWWNISF